MVARMRVCELNVHKKIWLRIKAMVVVVVLLGRRASAWSLMQQPWLRLFSQLQVLRVAVHRAG